MAAIDAPENLTHESDSVTPEIEMHIFAISITCHS